MDLSGFAARMQVLASLVDTNSDRLVRRVALAVDGAVVIATPVDTGRARSNWIVNIGSPSTEVIPAYVEGKGGSAGAAAARAALDQGSATIAGYQKGQEIHITNNLPYISRLNDGYSAQAPGNFVQIAVQQGAETVRGAKLLIEDNFGFFK